MDRSNLKISTAAPIIPEKVCIFGGKQWSMFFIGKSLGIYRRGIKKKSLFICYTITVAGLRVLEVAIFLTSC